VVLGVYAIAASALGLALTPAPHVKWFGAAVIGAVAALYLYFW